MHEEMEIATFLGAVLGFVLGLAVLLYGVSLNSGVAVNGPILAGGVIMLIALSIHVVGIGLLKEGEPS